MTTRRTPAGVTRLFAILALVGLIATACGAGAATSGSEYTVGSPASTSVRDQPTGETAVEYGASVEDWVVTTHGSEPTLSGITLPDSGQSEYSTIAWEDLIPPGSSGDDIRARYEERLRAVDVGSPEAGDLYAQMQAEYDGAATNSELHGQQIRLAGFVAPLTYDGDIITEFLLVPSFGACIHVPPPPPNQTIMVRLAKEDGLTVQEAWGAVWVEGDLVVASSNTVLAAASYRIDRATSGVYGDL